MAYESIKVDIIPGAENAEVLHFSQYDNKRPFFIELFNGGAEFIPESGMSLTLECRKRDGNIVILSDPVLTDNVAEFSTTEQLTACYGDNTAEIKIVDDNDLVIGSANFIINVEKSPTCGGLVSESEIDNLKQQIAAIVPAVIGDDYYNKTQTDALLANKANMSDLAPLASKAELTQAILDEDIALKNWVSSNFATPGYVNERIFNMLPVGSASGNPCIFNTEIEAPIQALTAEIVCGGGGGTPSTPIPIVGHSELNLTRCGANLVDFNLEPYGDAVEFWLPQGNYYCSLERASSISTAWYFGAVKTDGTYCSKSELGLNDWLTADGGYLYGNANKDYFAFTIPDGVSTIKIGRLNADNTNGVMINVGSTALPYAPYNGQTFTVAFGQTVYGGVYDKSGRLTITHRKYLLSDMNWNYHAGFFRTMTISSDIKKPDSQQTLTDSKCEIFNNVTWNDVGDHDNEYAILGPTGGELIVKCSSCSNLTEWASLINGYSLVYELATPIVIDVPSISVFAENGTNNITSDCIGDVNVNYKDTIQHYIDSRI